VQLSGVAASASASPLQRDPQRGDPGNEHAGAIGEVSSAALHRRGQPPRWSDKRPENHE
jgi:hypothetical protein